MKLEINLPKETVKVVYDILVEKLDEKCSGRNEALVQLCIGNTPKDHWVTLAKEYGEIYVILDIVTDLLAEALKKEGAL